jgi:hypothetical protein
MAEPLSLGEPPILPKDPSGELDNDNNNDTKSGCCSWCNFEHVDMAKGYNSLGLGKLLTHQMIMML